MTPDEYRAAGDELFVKSERLMLEAKRLQREANKLHQDAIIAWTKAEWIELDQPARPLDTAAGPC